MKVEYYAVFKEHTLGYVYTGSYGQKMLGVLHTSILKGSTYNYWIPSVWISQSDETELRKATEQDFEEFRCCLPLDYAELNAA